MQLVPRPHCLRLGAEGWLALQVPSLLDTKLWLLGAFFSHVKLHWGNLMWTNGFFLHLVIPAQSPPSSLLPDWDWPTTDHPREVASYGRMVCDSDGGPRDRLVHEGAYFSWALTRRQGSLTILSASLNTTSPSIRTNCPDPPEAAYGCCQSRGPWRIFGMT